MAWRILTGNVFDVLPTLPANHFHSVVTSPPYFGLRDYQTGTWEGGDKPCDHAQELPRFNGQKQTLAQVSGHPSKAEMNGRRQCQKCGAVRADEQLGSEATPEEYVANLVRVFADVRRVLRPDGVAWLNIGDSYCNTDKWGGGGKNTGKHVVDENGDVPSWAVRRKKSQVAGVKQKDLYGIPWMLAFALRADGWYLRSEIIWHKPNPMTESVTDRPSRCHEQVFLLTKSARYFYDYVATQEPATWRHGIHKPRPGIDTKGGNQGSSRPLGEPSETRNKRSVWRIPTKSFKGAHFATFPPALVEPCIKAGTSEHGCCPGCGKPWERQIFKERVATRPGADTKITGRNGGCIGESGEHSQDGRAQWRSSDVVGNRDPKRHVTRVVTVGWSPGCKCVPIETPIPCRVLDPFAGAGTTLMVASRLGRDSCGIELNQIYADMARKRITEDSPLFNG